MKSLQLASLGFVSLPWVCSRFSQEVRQGGDTQPASERGRLLTQGWGTPGTASPDSSARPS